MLRLVVHSDALHGCKLTHNQLEKLAWMAYFRRPPLTLASVFEKVGN
jgi:hypothetical protein